MEGASESWWRRCDSGKDAETSRSAWTAPRVGGCAALGDGRGSMQLRCWRAASPGARHHRSDEDVPGGHEIAAAAAEGVRGRTPSRNRLGIGAGSASLTPTEVEPNELGQGWCAKDLGEEDDGGEESAATVPSRPWGRAEDPGGDRGERDRIHSILIGPDYGGYLRSPALVFIAVKRGR